MFALCPSLGDQGSLADTQKCPELQGFREAERAPLTLNLVSQLWG